MSLDRNRVEVDEHRDAAQHDLGQDAGNQAERQQGQIAPAGNPDERAEGGGDDGNTDEAGEQAIELLDRGMP